MKETDYVYPIHAENRAGWLHFGLTARDYIAIQAMTGLLANTDIVPSVPPKGIAEDCYKIADAMIKQSEVRHE